MKRGFMIDPIFWHVALIGMVLFISVAAYIMKSLSFTGAIVACVLGVVLYVSGGITFLAAVFAFFASSSAWTKVRAREKKVMEERLYTKSGTRDHAQVLANGGAALLIAVLHLIFPDERTVVALFAAFAACNADTWASEIGVLSRQQPISLLTFKPVQKGISGGVTWVGMIGSIGGAFLLAAFYVVVRPVFHEIQGQSLIENAGLILMSGFLGSIFDSILGASVQPVYRDATTGGLTEKKDYHGVRNTKVKGIGFITNDMVNFISSALAAAIVLLFLGGFF